MKILLSIVAALCLALALGSCGDDTATSSQKQESSPAGSQQSESPEAPAAEIAIGEYEQEGPFSAVTGGKGNEKPHFEPSGQPAPKKVVTRELAVGSGPVARLGDKAYVYYAGADHATGKVSLYKWLPKKPSIVGLGEGIYGRSWEESMVGMKAGGIRQVIIPESEWAQGKPVDYVIFLKALEPKSGG